MRGKEKFINSSPQELDNILENEGKYYHYKIESYKRTWKSLIYNPYLALGTTAAIIIILLTGYYYSWCWRCVIEKVFAYGLVSILTGVIQHIITKRIERSDI